MQGHSPRARYAALAGFVDVCREAGVDPFSTMRAHGLDPDLLALPDAWAPASAVMAALDSAARTSGCSDLGLRMSRARSLSSLGPVSLALQAEPTLADAIDLLARFYPSYNEALRLTLRDEGTWSAVVIRFRVSGEGLHPQSSELAAGVLRFLAVSRDPAREPIVGVRLRHPAPEDTTEHEEFFAAGIEFSADEDAILFRREDLHRPAGDEDPQRQAYARRYLESMASADATPADEVRRLVSVLLPTGRCSAARVAASLGVDRRTVNRWLAQEGESFTSVVTAQRRAQVERSLREGGSSMTDIADSLGFTVPSSFSGWFVTQYGCSPTRWRALHRDELPEVT